MKSKKGFTLIEVLAIIVIIAIIAVITVPIVLNVIDNSKKGAVKSSAHGYVDSVNKLYVSKSLNNPDFEIPNNYYAVSDLKTMGVNINGDEPTGNSWIRIVDNEVVKGCLQFGDYSVSISNGIVGNVLKGECYNFGPTYVSSESTDTHMGIVYLDPTDIGNPCNALLASQNVNQYGKFTNVKTGCMKFYIFDENSNGTVDMILDHNTSGDVVYEHSNPNIPKIDAALADDVNGWIGNPRLISAQEIAHIVGADDVDAVGWDLSKYYHQGNDAFDPADYTSIFYFDGSGNSYSSSDGWGKRVASDENRSKYAWLYDNTHNCIAYGCNVEDNNKYDLRSPYDSKNNIIGYWTGDMVKGMDQAAWAVRFEGRLYVYETYNLLFGIRPVITVSKSLLGIE